MSPFTFRFLFLFLLLIGYAIGSIGLKAIREGAQNEGWVATQGKVVSSSVKEHQTSKGASWCPQISVSYMQGNRAFETKNIGLGRGCELIQSTAIEFSNKHKPGTELIVHVNPTNPAEAVLQTGVGKFAYFQLALGIFLAALGLLAFLPSHVVSKLNGKKS
jgi:hypothetical protein